MRCVGGCGVGVGFCMCVSVCVEGKYGFGGLCMEYICGCVHVSNECMKCMCEVYM